MICIYEKTETSFTYNGLGTLEPTYCSYSPYINDVWKLEMYLPYDPEGKYKLVANGRILKVTGIDCIQEQTSDYQLFSIETYRKEGNSIYVLAYPVGMDARFDTYANQVNANYKTASETIALINAVKAITLNNQEIDKYTVSTDISSSAVKSEVWNNTNIIAMLTDDEKGFIHKWGGEVCYDNYNIKVNQALGRTSGASEVRYGKNIRGMSYEEDTSNVITRLYPVANGGEILNGIDAYKIANTQYVDSTNVLDYPIPHIAYTNAPYNLVQMSDDGSETYAASILAFNQIKEDAYAWIRDALLGENTGGVDGLLVDIELAWFQENYGLTMDNDGTEGLVEYVTNKICNDSTRPIRSSAVKNLIYNAIKAGFEEILNESSFPSTKKLWSTFYSYTWDERGNFRVNKNGDAEYAWVYASSKWNQLDNDGYLTGAVDSATWKWYKVSGKKYKRYGNKKKKRYLRSQWWNINGVWYWFDDEGEATSGADLQSSCYDMFDSMNVSGESIYEALDYCQGTEAGLFELLYTQMTNYCSNLFVTEKISYPAPSITIDMVDLSKTVEYAGYENLLKIKLGDTVKCVNTKLNISTDLRVTGLTYDVLKGCNTNIQIGLTETSIIKEFDKSGNIIVSQKYSAGDGIKIEGNVISATGINLTDVVVGGQSVVYGGKAYIDIDEISGEGLQWFEETEDALYGVIDQLALIKDDKFKLSSGAYASMNAIRDNTSTGWIFNVAVEGDSSTLMMYYTKDYVTKAPMVFGSVGNKGWILILSKSDFTVHCNNHDTTGTSVNEDYYSDFSYSDIEDGWQSGYIISGGEHIYGYINGYAVKGSATVNGETWYGMLVGGYDATTIEISSFRSLTDYLPVADYPMHDALHNAGYFDMDDLIESTVPLVRDLSSNNYNGMSREGNLAFFAGADDEHGTNAPIKIYRDGTYEGIGGKVDDVKVNNVSVVTDKIANIDLTSYATKTEVNNKQDKLTPLLGMVIDEQNNIYLGEEKSQQIGHTINNWEIIQDIGFEIYDQNNKIIFDWQGYQNASMLRSKKAFSNVTSIDYEFGMTLGSDGGFIIGISNTKYNSYINWQSADLIKYVKVNGSDHSSLNEGTIDCTGVTGDIYVYVYDYYVEASLNSLDIKYATAKTQGGNSGRPIAYKCLTQAQYTALSEAEKKNGVLYFVSSNANGESGFFTPYKSVSAQPQTSEEAMALVSNNANGAMGIEIITDANPQNDNLLYLVSEV